MVKSYLRFCILVFFLMLTGCAAHYSQDAVHDPYGFFSGLWHGLIIVVSIFVNLISWLLSLFGVSFLSDIQIIGRPNTGFGYYCGFVIGILANGSANK